MTKTFCDRCGKEIRDGKRAWLQNTHMYMIARLICRDPRSDWVEENRYLCTDCEDSYIHWFMNPEEKHD